MTIAEFIEQRLVEWEKAAKAAEPRWAVDVVDCPDIDGAIGGYAVDHVMLNDPARVLRQCEGLRAILEDYERYKAERRRAMNGWDNAGDSPIVKAIASIWSDHPDYQQEWKP